MPKQLYLRKPPIKTAEFGSAQDGGAYIYFEEYVDIPGLEKADISIRFERNNSFDEIQALVSQMRKMGFIFAVEK